MTDQETERLWNEIEEAKKLYLCIYKEYLCHRYIAPLERRRKEE